MKRLGSYLIILLLLTAYGRCLADQMGVLHNSETACCQTACGNSSDRDPEAAAHDNNSEQQDKNDDAPCPLCLILSSDSLLLQNTLEIPAPSLYYVHFLWDDFSIKKLTFSEIRQSGFGLSETSVSDLPEEHRAQQQRIVVKLCPVRGPAHLIS